MSDARISAGRYAPGQAPRITQAEIDALITDEKFIILPDGRTTICQLTLVNGFTVRGEASTVYVENFDPEIGQRISRENAKQKIWLLEGYLLAQRRYEDEIRFAGN